MESISRVVGWCFQTAVSCAANITAAICILVLSILAGALVGVLCLCFSIMVVAVILTVGAAASVVIIGLGAAGLGELLAKSWHKTIGDLAEKEK